MTVEDLFSNFVGTDKKEILKEWLMARQHILNKGDHLNKLKDIAPNSDTHSQVNIIIDNADTSLAMAIARQVALITHCPNFKESDKSTRTIISIIYNNANIKCPFLNKFITSNGFGSAIEFGLKIIETLLSKSEADTIKNKIQYIDKDEENITLVF